MAALRKLISVTTTILAASLAPSMAQANDTSFFITSTSMGKGGDLGGLQGADKHCQDLATAAGAGGRTWRAYLSTQAAALGDTNFVNARDRIGKGPWRNAKGIVVAWDVNNLHSPDSNLNKDTALDERGQPVKGRVDKPNQHDILTGSRADGTAFPGGPFPDMTCGSWTKSTPEGAAMLGHFDRVGPVASSWATSWNSAHPSLGCSQDKLRPTGGEGYFYCFAAD